MYKTILVPLDGSAAAERGLDEAIGLARGLSARLHLLFVLDDYVLMSEVATVVNFSQLRDSLRDSGNQLLARAQRKAADQGVEAVPHVAEVDGGRIADVIVEQAGALGCDLVVMGTHGRRGVRRVMMGSDAEQVVRTCPVPVLLVREPGAA